MATYLIDVNLPNYFGEWRPPAFQHVVELNRHWSDTEIWNYAQQNGLTILSKDYDFYNRIIATEAPPKVIHFRLGNMKLKDFQTFIAKNWSDIAKASISNKLVIVYEDEILGVN